MMSGRGKKAKWSAGQKLRRAHFKGTGAHIESHRVEEVCRAVLAANMKPPKPVEGRDVTEEAILKEIDNRDYFEDMLSKAYTAATGKQPEWSNLFTPENAVLEIEQIAHRAKSQAEMQAKLDKALEHIKIIAKTAALLQQNAIGCASDHHSHDFAEQGMPGWLYDTENDIKNARKALSELEETSS